MIKSQYKPKRNELSVETLTRVVCFIMEPETAYTGKDMVRLIEKCFAVSGPHNLAVVTATGAKCGYIVKHGKTKGTSWFSNKKPVLNEKEQQYIEAMTTGQVTPVAPPPVATRIPMAPPSGLLPGIFPDTDPNLQPSTAAGVPLSNVWQGQKIITDRDGTMWLVLTTKIRLRSTE